MAEGALETEKGLLNETKKKPKKAACLSKRWTIAYMGMWFGVLGYGLNTNMSVAIVCMASTTHNTSSSDVTSPLSEGNATDLSFLKNGTYDIGHAEKHNETQLKDNIDDHDSITYIDDDNQITEKGNERNTVNVDILQCAEIGSESYKQNAEFSWDKRTQSFILSGFFYGYIFVQIVGGWAAGRFGGKLMIGAFMGLGSLVTLLIPSLARTSPYALVAARVVIGMSAGLALPGWFKLTAVWARENERTRFISIVWFGAFGVLFVACWWFIVQETPSSDLKNNETEIQLLKKTLDESVNRTPAKTVIPTVPWLDMVTYTPIYGPLVAHICDTWTFYLILTCLPQYIKEVLKFDIQSNGVFSSLPFLSMMVGIALSGLLADQIRTRKLLSITKIRKLLQTVSFLGVATCISVPGFLTCEERYLVIVLLCLCTFFGGIGVASGYTCTYVDMSPRFSPILFGISNTVASIPGIFAPLVVAEVTKNQSSEEWRIVLLTAAGVSVFGTIVYDLLASSELAPWSDRMEFEIEISLDKDQKSEL
ncbi:sialin-like isoform X2 [Mya arenaria]|uniref:sialin-like isoform X2 n=1 Tax=Mya arenaria TaxID=6604 RepID=UPI0022DEE424|nr:sialin-like isoform X2 [Mya arenaria]